MDAIDVTSLMRKNALNAIGLEGIFSNPRVLPSLRTSLPHSYTTCKKTGRFTVEHSELIQTIALIIDEKTIYLVT